MKSETEFQAERMTGLGGSDVASILGLSPWKTAIDVWLDKTGKTDNTKKSVAQRIGTELEGCVASMYSEQTGRRVEVYPTMLRRGCCIGHVDRLVVPDGAISASTEDGITTDTVLECKTTSVDWGGEVPLYYQTQVQHYMGLDPHLMHADVAVLDLVRKRFQIYRIERDDEVIEAMRKKCEAWWQRHVIEGQPPDPHSEKDVLKLYTQNSQRWLEVDDLIMDDIHRLCEVRDDIKRLQGEESKLRDYLCTLIGDAEGFKKGERTLITWRWSKPSTKVDWQSVAQELQAPRELIERHTTTSPGTRRFVVKA